MSYVDHVQSVVLGSLIALLVPLYIRNSNDVHVWVVFLFITLQALAFIGFLGVMLVSQNLTLGKSHPIIFGLLLFYSLREGMIYVAWHIVAHHLNGSLEELDYRLNA